MLGIDGVCVLAARRVDGELEVTVETTTDRDSCRARGVRAHCKGRPTVIVRDVTAFGRRARLVWRKRRWRCPEPVCPGGSWTQQHHKHLRATNVIESTFATVRLRQRTTKGPGCRDAGTAMAYKLLDAAQARWRRINGHELVALVRAGATFIDGRLQGRSDTDAHAA